MNDDLISRKEALQVLEDVFAEYWMAYGREHGGFGAAAQEVIEKLPTAFDKEKVIEELVELRQMEYNDYDEESETMDGEEIYDEGRSQGRFEAYRRAIEIVEKGGIE